MSIFPIITEERQSIYEGFALWNKDAKQKNDIPCICGVYGRACRSMNEKANSMLCTDCPLSLFISVVEAIGEYVKIKKCRIDDLIADDFAEICKMLKSKVVKTDSVYIHSVVDYLKLVNSTY